MNKNELYNYRNEAENHLVNELLPFWTTRMVFLGGYEAQICHNQDAYAGWLWKPGTPTGKASKLLTKDGEWFLYKIRAVGDEITFWINNEKVMMYKNDEYKTGHLAIQEHNPCMKIEAKDLYYRDLTKK
jgi:hypothetical protein